MSSKKQIENARVMGKGRLGHSPANKLPREIRICACGCCGTFECKVNSKQKILCGHLSKTLKNPFKSGNIWRGRKRSKESVLKSIETRRITGGIINGALSSFKCFNNKTTELPMKKILDDLGYKYKHPYPIHGLKHFFPVDFFLYEEKIIIETDGIYWHCHPGKYKDDYYHKQKKMTAQEIWDVDRQRTIELQEAGYKILRFWEKEFDNNKVKKSIEELLCSKV